MLSNKTCIPESGQAEIPVYTIGRLHSPEFRAGQVTRLISCLEGDEVQSPNVLNECKTQQLEIGILCTGKHTDKQCALWYELANVTSFFRSMMIRKL